MVASSEFQAMEKAMGNYFSKKSWKFTEKKISVESRDYLYPKGTIHLIQ